MPKQSVQTLMTDLHERFGDELISPQQQELMAQVQSHIHDMKESEPAEPGFLDTVELLVSEVEADHPNAAAVLGQILETLKNMGV